MDRIHPVWTHGYDGVRTGAIGREIVEIKRTKKATFEEFLEFKILSSSRKASLLLEDTELQYKGVRYFIHQITETEETGKFLEVYANANWYRLGERKYVGSLLIDDLSVRDGLETILQGSGWSIDVFSAHGGQTYSLEVQDKTYLQILRAWANITGLYLSFEPVNKIVNLTTNLGQNLGTAFRRGRNIRNYKRTRIAPQITRMFPYGADNLSIAGIHGTEYIEDFSFYTDRGVSLEDARENHTKDSQYVDSSIVNENDLLRVGQAKLAEQNEVVNYVELGVIDVSELIDLNEEYKVWDTVRFVHEEFGVDQQTTVVSTIHYDREPWRNQIELDTQIDLTQDDLSMNARATTADAWLQFVGPIAANFEIRNDSIWTVARIPLRFREGARYHTSFQIPFIGRGSGVATFAFYNATDDVNVKVYTVAYSDGVPGTVNGTFAVENVPSGSFDYRLRVSVVGSGGPSIDNGVDLALEELDGETNSWWIMVQRAVRETPPLAPNSITFLESDTWIVPDNVTAINIQAFGGASGAPIGPETGGAIIQAEQFPVIPGETLTIWIGQGGGTVAGGPGNEASYYKFGGGFAGVARNGQIPHTDTAPSDLLIIAGAGGGRFSTYFGGVGGFIRGEDASPDDGAAGKGGTQYEGGRWWFEPGNPDSDAAGRYLQGGNYITSSSFANLPASGGGGYYGGSVGDGGGGGSSYIHPSAINYLIQDGANLDYGKVIISWPDPSAPF